jgi:tetratricopeptide (TPR) repeat protein
MLYKRILISLFFLSLIVPGLHAQQGSTSGQKKVVRLNSVKVDTTDPNKKALNKFSREKMFEVTTPPKQLRPEEVKALDLFNEGSKKGKAGNFDGAILDFTKSLDLVKSINTYVKRGYAFLMIGNYGAAITDANEALKINDAFPKAYFIRGIARYESGDYKGAKIDMTVYLDKDRHNPIAFNYMAALNFMEQDYKGALANYNEVVKLDPKYPDIYTNRGMMRHYNQDFKGAIQDYDEALKLDPKNATAYNNRGAAKMMLKELNAALADFNQAIILDSK